MASYDAINGRREGQIATNLANARAVVVLPRERDLEPTIAAVRAIRALRMRVDVASVLLPEMMVRRREMSAPMEICLCVCLSVCVAVCVSVCLVYENLIDFSV